MASTQYLGFSDLPSIYNINLPVGPNMPNLRDDVLLVQTLLQLANFKSSSDPGAAESSRALEIDGLFGVQTQRMIEAFEVCVRKKHLLLNVDGVIEPSSTGGYTPEGVIYKIIHLNRFAKQAAPLAYQYDLIPIDPGTHPILRQSLVSSCPAAQME